MSAPRETKGGGRARLIAAAKALLWESGFEKMSPADVLARSGAGQGSLYHHFDGKLDLARAALAEMVREEIAAVDAIFLADSPPVERLNRYLSQERQALRGCRIGRLANETAMELPEFRAPVSTYFEHVEAALRQALDDGRADGTFAADLDASALAAALLAIIEGGYVIARGHWDARRMVQALKGGEVMLATVMRQSGVVSTLKSVE